MVSSHFHGTVILRLFPGWQKWCQHSHHNIRAQHFVDSVAPTQQTPLCDICWHFSQLLQKCDMSNVTCSFQFKMYNFSRWPSSKWQASKHKSTPSLLCLALLPSHPSRSFPPTLSCQSLCCGCCAERTQQLPLSWAARGEESWVQTWSPGHSSLWLRFDVSLDPV